MTKKIKKNIYNDLWKMLNLFNSEQIRKFFRRLNTLHPWCRNRMSLSFIQKTMMTIKKKKQFNEIIRLHENNMYYFDIRKIIFTVLSSIWALKVFHIDIIKIVNNSFEYWHSFSWKSSIRTCLQNYVTYFDLTFIFFFDFVRFRHVNETKTRKCIE